MSTRLGLLGAALATLGLAACSGPNPTAGPPIDQLAVDVPQTADLATLGIYRLNLDFDQRQAAAFTLGDSVIPDLTALFTQSLCSDCLRVTAIGQTPEGNPFFDITIDHPIASGRPELAAFDVQGVLISDRAADPLVPIPAFGVSTRPPYLRNADGATRQVTAAVEAALGTTLDADVFPFRNFAVDATPGNFDGANVNGFADVTNPSGHNVFAPGDTSTVRYELEPEAASEVEFLFVLTASFYRSYTTRGSNLFQKNNPVYFLPEGNRKEAWQVTAEVVGNALLAGDTGSQAALEVTIMDWQNGQSPQGLGWDPANPNPATQPRDGFPTPSDMASAQLVVPQLLSVPLDLLTFNVSGSGSGATDPLVIGGIQVRNVLGAPAGDYIGLVRVVDTRTPESGPADEGDVLHRDGLTFGQLPALETYAVVSLHVSDDAVFVGSDFFNTGHLLTRTGGEVELHQDRFLGVEGVVNKSAIRNGKVYVIGSGSGFSGDGNVQVYDAATGALLVDAPMPASSNPFDLAFRNDDEVYVTAYNFEAVYRVNVDPGFAGTRLLQTIPLTGIADPGFNLRATEIIATAGGRVFLVGNHLDAGFSPAPAGILVELDPTTNTVLNDWATTGVSNTGGVREMPGGAELFIVGAGPFFPAGNGGSGRFNLGTNTFVPDPAPGRNWAEMALTSTGLAYLTDQQLATLAQVTLPSDGTTDFDLQALPPGYPGFPFLSGVAVDRGDTLYVSEFGTGTIQVFDASTATSIVPPVWLATMDIPGGADALGTSE